MGQLFSVPGCRVERVTRAGPADVLVVARVDRAAARCPCCGRESAAVHSVSTRRPADLPALGRAVRLALVVRRFYCRAAA